MARRNLRELARAVGLTLGKLAKKSGISAGLMSMMSNGYASTQANRKALARVLRCEERDVESAINEGLERKMDRGCRNG